MNLSHSRFYQRHSFLVAVWLVFVVLLSIASFSPAPEVKLQKNLHPIVPKLPVVLSAGDLTIRIIQCPQKEVEAGEELRNGLKVVASCTFSNTIGKVTVDIILSSKNTYPMPAPLAVYSPNYSDKVLLLGGRQHISFPGPGNVDVKLNGNNTIPPDTPPGKYYLGAVIDAGNGVAEINERNNVFFCPIEVIIPPGGHNTMFGLPVPLQTGN